MNTTGLLVSALTILMSWVPFASGLAVGLLLPLPAGGPSRRSAWWRMGWVTAATAVMLTGTAMAAIGPSLGLAVLFYLPGAALTVAAAVVGYRDYRNRRRTASEPGSPQHCLTAV